LPPGKSHLTTWRHPINGRYLFVPNNYRGNCIKTRTDREVLIKPDSYPNGTMDR